MEISSTFIRNAYQTGKDIRFFLPEGVRPYFGSVANQWHTCDRRYTYLGYEVYILCHLKYIFFEKGSYTVIIYSFAILGQSAKFPLNMFYSTAVKDDPRNIKTGSPDNLLEYPNI